MARYRVQGPDGAIHVFEGPDGATPDQISQAAMQTFGGGRGTPAISQAQQDTADWQKTVRPDDPGIIGSTVIGAGRTTDRVLKGLEQAYLAAKSHFESPTLSSLVTGQTQTDHQLAQLHDQATEDDRLYKPLQDAHPIATGVGEALPSLVIPGGGAATAAGTVARLALAGALPGALEYGTAEERLKRAAAGSAANVAGGVLIPKLVQVTANAVPAIGRAVRAVAEPLTQNGRANIAGRTLNAAAGQDAAGAASRLASASELIPGSLPTAGQVAENGGIAALERSVAQSQPAEFAARGMDQSAARVAALRSIAKDQPALAAATAARDAAAKPAYQAAFSQSVDVDGPLKALLTRPSVQAALARAQKIAQEDGRSFGLTAEQQVPASAILDASGNPVRAAFSVPGKVTGQTLQDLKMGLDALLSDQTTGIAGKEADLIKSTRGQLLNWMENKIPGFQGARTGYAANSAPINQMQIGSELMDKLAPALSDYGALGRETAAKYAQALRDAPALARNATKFPGAKLEDIMTPEQMGLINNVARDLARKSNAQDLGRGVGSDTFQKLSMSNIAERSGAPGVVNAALNLPGVNRLAKFAYSGPDEQIQTALARALLDPKTAAALMTRPGAALQPAIPFRQILQSAPSAPTQITGRTAGQALANLFAQ